MGKPRYLCPVCNEMWVTGSIDIGSWLEHHYWWHKLEALATPPTKKEKE